MNPNLLCDFPRLVFIDIESANSRSHPICVCSNFDYSSFPKAVQSKSRITCLVAGWTWRERQPNVRDDQTVLILNPVGITIVADDVLYVSDHDLCQILAFKLTDSLMK